MDALSDLLRVVRFDGAYFYNVQAAAPWGIDTLGARELTPRVLPRAEHLIAYHVLLAGSCWSGLTGKDRVELNPGDVIFYPRGDPHVMSSQRRGDPSMLATAPSPFASTVQLGPNAAPTAELTCGFFGCDRRPFNPLLSALPRRVHVKGSNTAWGAKWRRRLTEETKLGRAGASGMLTRLAELMFLDVLRRYLDELPPQRTGWLAGLRDDVVGCALSLLHARPGERWTLERLAREASTSRSNLAKRFAFFVKEPPMQYLTKWRMQVAANLLAQGSEKVASVAQSVGYDSEAAFSRAFKKATGVAPSAWRDARRDALV